RRRREAPVSTANSSASMKQTSVPVQAPATTVTPQPAGSAPLPTAANTKPTTAPANLLPVQTPTGPAASRPAAKVSVQNTTPRSAAPPKVIQPAPTSTQAFLKHAN